jgi:pimeloyl-ACP methyl ester carboxylesterase
MPSRELQVKKSHPLPNTKRGDYPNEKEFTVTQQQGIVKGDALQKIGKAGFIIAATLIVLGGLLMLPADDLSLYDSHPNPAANYAEAVQRIESMRATEVGFNPDCQVILLTHGANTTRTIVFAPGYGSCPAAFKELGTQFYDRGYNILIAPLPYNGLADRLTTEEAKLRAEDLIRYTDQVVDIGRGLGDHLTLAGISAGGLVTGWAAQQRQDVDQAVLISPGFGFAVMPERLTPLVFRAFIRLPNWFIWEDPKLKADAPPEHNYPRASTRALAQILRLSLATQDLARQKAPAAGSILVVTNLNDPDLDNVVTDKVADLWRAHGAADVQTYQFTADLQLGHDLTDMQQPDQNAAAVVYPKLLELIDR